MEYKKIPKKLRKSFLEPLEYFSADGKYLGLKRRRLIHTKGLFHQGAQVFIVKEKNGKLYFLSQKRKTVDIASAKLDHSAAVQMLPVDKRNPINAIKRALLSELNINNKDIKNIKLISKNIDMRVSKRYCDEPKSLYNREFVYTTIVVLKPNTTINIDKNKVDSVKWYEYESFIKNVLKNPINYAKNLRNNFVNQHIANLIRYESYRLLKMPIPKLEKKLIKSSYYSDRENNDIVLSKFGDNSITVQKLINGKIIERSLNNINEKYFVYPNLLKNLKTL